MPNIHIDHPLLKQLQAFNLEAAKEFPTSFDPGLGQISLLLEMPLKHGGYYCTPLNSLSFGGTGCDGVHFSFIVENNSITEDSPVIVTTPEGGCGYSSPIAAENLRDFLRASLIGGFLVHGSLSTYLHTGKNPHAGCRIPDDLAPIRDALAERFSLTPQNYSLNELHALQARHQSKILYPSWD